MHTKYNMSGEDEWCDVACALEGLGDASPMQEEEWEVLGKSGTPQSHKKVTDITPTVSLADLAAAPGSGGRGAEVHGVGAARWGRCFLFYFRRFVLFSLFLLFSLFGSRFGI